MQNFVEAVKRAQRLEGEKKYVEAAKVYESCGDYDHAIAAYRKAGLTDNAADLMRINGKGEAAAKLYESMKQYEKAAAIYEEIFEFAKAAGALILGGDYARAAALLEQGDEPEKAAGLYEKLGNLRKAQQLYEQAGNSAKAQELAARIPPEPQESEEDLPELPVGELLDASEVVDAVVKLLRAGKGEEASRLYGSCQETIGYSVLAAVGGDARAERAAAQMFVHANDFAMAAQLLDNMGEYRAAADMYERAGDSYLAAEMSLRVGDVAAAAERYERGGHFRQAGEYFQSLGNVEKAAACYEKAGSHFLAGKLWAQAKKPAKAVQHLQKIRREEPEFAEASALLQQALQAMGGASAPRAVPAAAASDGPRNSALTSLMDGFEFLKGTPLFHDLSLDEMREVYDTCEIRRFAAGEVLVEQDTPGSALLIFRKGTARVVHRSDKGEELLARLGPGAPAGEMSLVGDTPTSARVVAETEGEAFCITRDAFARLLASSDAMALKLYRFLVATLSRRLRNTSRNLAGAQEKARQG